MNTKKIFIGMILAEIIISIMLGIKIYKNKSNVLGATKINPIDKKNIQHPASHIPEFYELKSNKQEVSTLNGHTGTYNFNNDALNERYDYSVEKEKNTYRIITLGDSFTMGVQVDTENNWPEQLEDMLNSDMKCEKYDKFEVINLGVLGYDIEYTLERFKLRGKKYNPDTILWLLKGDDLYQVNREILPLANKYTDELKKSGEFNSLVEKGDPYPGWRKANNEYIKRLDLNKTKKSQINFFDTFEDLYKKNIDYVFLPYASKPGDDEEMSELLKSRSSNRENIYTQTLPNIYLDTANYIQGDGHPTEKGYTIIAKELFSFIKRNKVVCD